MPKVTSVTVRAETRFNDPYEQYRNHCPHVAITAEVLPGEDHEKVILDLQEQARTLLHVDCTTILATRKGEHDDEIRRRAIANLRTNLATYKSSLAHHEERAANWRAKLAACPATEEELKAANIEPWEKADWESHLKDAENDIRNYTERITKAQERLAELEAGEGEDPDDDDDSAF